MAAAEEGSLAEVGNPERLAEAGTREPADNFPVLAAAEDTQPGGNRQTVAEDSKHHEQVQGTPTALHLEPGPLELGILPGSHPELEQVHLGIQPGLRFQQVPQLGQEQRQQVWPPPVQPQAPLVLADPVGRHTLAAAIYGNRRWFLRRCGRAVPCRTIACTLP